MKAMRAWLYVAHRPPKFIAAFRPPCLKGSRALSLDDDHRFSRGSADALADTASVAQRAANPCTNAPELCRNGRWLRAMRIYSTIKSLTQKVVALALVA